MKEVQRIKPVTAKKHHMESWVFYGIGIVFVVGMKYFYSRAGSDELKWILTPTAGWVGFLCGKVFEYESQIGYINHGLRFIIAPSCSGVQFMIITASALIFSFSHRMGTMKKGFLWTAFSFAFSFPFTVFVNGVRIGVSIYLPQFLRQRDAFGGLLTPERLHTAIGTVVYTLSLIMIYHAGGYAAEWLAGFRGKGQGYPGFKYSGRNFSASLFRCMKPLCWYFAVVLCLPLINRMYQRDYEGFFEYAVFILCMSLSVVVLFCLTSLILRWCCRLAKALENHFHINLK